MRTHSTQKQSGNILIYIMGAIFLLGILIIITKGNYQPGAGIDSEAVTIRVSEVRRYAAELERGVRYAMQNGISEADLRFAHPNASSFYGTYGTNPKAEIFNPLGGGVEWRDPPTGIQAAVTPWVFTGNNDIKAIGSTCTLARCTDLVAILPDVTKSFCIQINNSVGITNPSGNPPKELSSFSHSFVYAGTFSYSSTLDVTGNYTDGFPEGCIEGNSSAGNSLPGHYYFYKVLLAR